MNPPIVRPINCDVHLAVPDTLHKRYIATGAMMEAKHLGLVVREAPSLVGFDDTAMPAHLDPSLTTIRIAGRQMGRETADLIISYPGGETLQPPAPLVAELILRESMAPPPPKERT